MTYDPNMHQEVTVNCACGDDIAARFDPEDETGIIQLFWDDDLCEASPDELTTDDRSRILEAVGVRLVELGVMEVPAAWYESLR